LRFRLASARFCVNRCASARMVSRWVLTRRPLLRFLGAVGAGIAAAAPPASRSAGEGEGVVLAPPAIFSCLRSLSPSSA
jgi:hypothetical protein